MRLLLLAVLVLAGGMTAGILVQGAPAFAREAAASTVKPTPTPSPLAITSTSTPTATPTPTPLPTATFSPVPQVIGLTPHLYPARVGTRPDRWPAVALFGLSLVGIAIAILVFLVRRRRARRPRAHRQTWGRSQGWR